MRLFYVIQIKKQKKNKKNVCNTHDWNNQGRMKHYTACLLVGCPYRVMVDIRENEKQGLGCKKLTQKMCVKLNCNHPVQSKQNKQITRNIHSTQKKMKQKVKLIWTKVSAKLCQLKLRIWSTIYDLNASTFILNWEVSYANCMTAWFISHATFRCYIVHILRPGFGGCWIS